MFTWTSLQVKKTRNAGMGLYAKKAIKRGTLFPILGRLRDPGELARTGFSHALYDAHARVWPLHKYLIDGHPDLDVHENVGSRGLAITMMANEPATKASKANAVFKQGYMLITKDIRIGAQITVCYGLDEANEDRRKREGYKLIDDLNGRDPAAGLKLPSPEDRALVSMKYARECARDPSPWLSMVTGTKPRGIPNTGNTCHLAAIIQALLPAWKMNAKFPKCFRGVIKHVGGHERMEKAAWTNLVDRVTSGIAGFEGNGAQEGVLQSYLALTNMMPPFSEESLRTSEEVTLMECAAAGCSGSEKITWRNHVMIHMEHPSSEATQTLERLLEKATDSTVHPKGRICSTCSTRYETLPVKTTLRPKDGVMILIISPNLDQRNNKGALAYTMSIPLGELRLGLDEQQYELQSIIDYWGHGTGGPYITYSRRKEHWYYFNDSKAQRMDSNTLALTCPVMLVYTKSSKNTAHGTGRITSSGNTRAARTERRERRATGSLSGINEQIGKVPMVTEMEKKTNKGKRKAPQKNGAVPNAKITRMQGPTNTQLKEKESRPKPTSPDATIKPYAGMINKIMEGKSLGTGDVNELLIIIKNTYGVHTLGLDDPIYQDQRNYDRGIVKINPKDLWKARQTLPWSIQVLLLPNHWVVAEHIKGDSVIIYDTLPLESNKPIILTKCVEIFGEDNIIYERAIQTQRGGQDCGILATAIVVDLIAKSRPVQQVTYIQSECRQHIIQCLTQHPPTLRLFPANTTENPAQARRRDRTGKRRMKDPGLQGKLWGNEKDRGYLYEQKGEKSVYIGQATWLPSHIEGVKTYGRGLFAGARIEKGQPITPYAGHGTFVNNDISGTDKSAFMKTLTKIGGQAYVIDGYRQPKQGFGMAQFCNDRSGSGPNNAELIVRDSHGGRGINHQMGIYLKATRAINIGEEITTNYGRSYFKRMKNNQSREDGPSETTTSIMEEGKRTEHTKRKREQEYTQDKTNKRTSKEANTPQAQDPPIEEGKDAEENTHIEQTNKHKTCETQQTNLVSRQSLSTHKEIPRKEYDCSISKVIDSIKNTHKPGISYHTAIENQARKCLRVNQTINQHITKLHRAISWHTKEKELEKLGATGGTEQAYIEGNRTWINLGVNPDGLHKLKDITNEIAQNLNTLTVAVITQEEAKELTNHAKQHHQTLRITTIATYQPNETTIEKSTNNPWKLTTERNEQKITLIAIHNVEVNISKQQIDSITKATHTAMNQTQQTSIKHVHEPQFHLRTEHNIYPSLTMYREHPRRPANHLENHNLLARAIGILPRNMLQILSKAGHKQEELNKDKIKQIERKILYAATEAYRRYEQWMKRDLLRE